MPPWKSWQQRLKEHIRFLHTCSDLALKLTSKAESTYATQVGRMQLLHSPSWGCLENCNFAFSGFLFINITIQMFSKYLPRTSIHSTTEVVWKCSNQTIPKGRQHRIHTCSFPATIQRWLTSPKTFCSSTMIQYQRWTYIPTWCLICMGLGNSTSQPEALQNSNMQHSTEWYSTAARCQLQAASSHL